MAMPFRLLLMDEPALADATGIPTTIGTSTPRGGALLRIWFRRITAGLPPSEHGGMREGKRYDARRGAAEGVDHPRIAFLMESAGKLLCAPSAEAWKKRALSGIHGFETEPIGRPPDVEMLVLETGLCNECATWRTGIDDKTGRCRVCTMREHLRGREEACALELSMMAPEQRLVYERTEMQRRTRRILERPKKRESCPMSRYERSKAEERYLIDIEEWEYRTLKLRYDAAKTRLRRMREKTGRNPRKGNPPEARNDCGA
ncbi:MAG: hypothetical protein ACLSVD_08210 [Eggerthellaceae bacterium]